MWPDRRYIDLVGLEHPLIQAPMAGANLSTMAAAVTMAGGLGSLPCGMLNTEQARSEMSRTKQQTDKPYGVNFFCHITPPPDEAIERRWRERLARYYVELAATATSSVVGARAPFDAAMCDLVVEMRPRVVSFHFGLPEAGLLRRVKEASCIIQSSATTVEEARWLEANGADVVIAQGMEAGGHRGMFIATSLESQVGTMALVPQIVDAVHVPVIAAGGIGDARGVAAALSLGASAVQIGTAFLLCPEATISEPYRQALRAVREDNTAVTNVISGRPARGIINRLMAEIGPISADAPPYPLAANAVQPLRLAAEARGSSDFSPLWSGQAAAFAREISAGELTRALARDAVALMRTPTASA